MITYRSTRGRAPELAFGEVLLAGLASDGGLYVPTQIPELDPSLDGAMPYHELATTVMWPFVEGSIERDRFACRMSLAESPSARHMPTSR